MSVSENHCFRDLYNCLVVSDRKVNLAPVTLFNSFYLKIITYYLFIVELITDTKENVRVCVYAKSLQSCLTLCDPMDCSPPGSSVHGILQARILERVLCPPPGYLPDPGMEPATPALQTDSLPLSHWGSPCKENYCVSNSSILKQ